MERNESYKVTTNERPKRVREIKSYYIDYVCEDEEKENVDLTLAAVKALRQSCLSIASFFETAINNYQPDDSVITEDGSYEIDGDMIWDIVAQEMSRRCPAVRAGKNIFSSYSVSVNSIKVKLGSSIGFEINLNYNVEDHKARVHKATGIVNMYTKNTALENDLIANGFLLKEKK